MAFPLFSQKRQSLAQSHGKSCQGICVLRPSHSTCHRDTMATAACPEVCEPRGQAPTGPADSQEPGAAVVPSELPTHLLKERGPAACRNCLRFWGCRKEPDTSPAFRALLGHALGPEEAVFGEKLFLS